MKRILVFFSVVLMATTCQTAKNSKQMKNHSDTSEKYPYTNHLIHESSPYLLQHAHNPVDWYPWGKAAFEKAKKEHKLLIISIGYAACHWCHVMEHESFEDTLVANLMNKYFVSVKVDREEHPDVDEHYMNAVQLMTGRGGWPLNVVALPDGRPVWGGTYFPKKQWISILRQIAGMWQKNPDKFYQIAKNVEKGVRNANMPVKMQGNRKPDTKIIDRALQMWKQYADKKMGGFMRAPKFPMPGQYRFLLRASVQKGDIESLNLVRLTLEKMQEGGIYDHVNGGFSRYSTDTKWHIPHFEKMLYDNALLLSLYADGYKYFGDSTYEKTVAETVSFLERELRSPQGGFYNSLDADSRNPEGKLEEGYYYYFTLPELKKAIGEDFPLFLAYYNINNYGWWEDGKYVLIKKMSDKAFTEKYNISAEKLSKKVKQWKKILYELRRKKARPRLDNKIMTSWNALAVEGLVDAYQAFGEKHYLDLALQTLDYLLQYHTKADGGLWHTVSDKRKIDGLMTDYAFLISALIKVYETTGRLKYLHKAEELTRYVYEHFSDARSGLFRMSGKDNDLSPGTINFKDKVIPSANSVMAHNLFKLARYTDSTGYEKKAADMLATVLPQATSYPFGYYEWLNLLMDETGPYYEVAIVGDDALTKANMMQKYYLPNVMYALSTGPSDEPLLKSRYTEGKTLIYVCENKTCQLPVEESEKAYGMINLSLGK